MHCNPEVRFQADEALTFNLFSCSCTSKVPKTQADSGGLQSFVSCDRPMTTQCCSSTVQVGKVVEVYMTCRPRCTRAAVLVGATEDAYVSPQSVRELAAHWPASEVRWVKGGHVSAFLLQQPAFRRAISDSIDRLDECPTSK